jgi:hypothetical protein
MLDRSTRTEICRYIRRLKMISTVFLAANSKLQAGPKPVSDAKNFAANDKGSKAFSWG